MEQINELFLAFVPIILEHDEEAKKEKVKTFFAEKVPPHCALFEKRLTGREFLVGDSVSVADLYFMVVHDTIKQCPLPEEEVLTKFPNVAAHLAKVRALPAVVAHNKKCNSK